MGTATVYISCAVTLLLLQVILRIATSLQQLQQKNCKPVRTPDRYDPFGWRAFRALRKAGTNHNVPDYFALCMDKVGTNAHTVQRRFLFTRLMMTRDPENIKTVLATQVSDWELGAIRRGLLSEYTGPSLITSEGPAWKQSKSRVRPQFSPVSVSNLALHERHTKELLAKLGPDGGHEGWTATTDIQPLFFNMTLDVITEFLYGQSLHSQDPSKAEVIGPAARTRPPDFETFGRCIDDVTDWVASMSMLGKWYKFAPARKFKQSRAKMRRLVDWYVERALKQVTKAQSMEPAASPEYVILDELARITDDKIWLRNETLNLLTAGRSTTAALFSWLFYYLAANPSQYRKLRRTVVDEIGTESTAKNVTVSKLRSCHHLQSCINEALRLGSPVPNTTRAAARDTTLPRGGGPEGNDPIFIAKGNLVMLNFFNLHHREDIWGKDAEEFKPERWEKHTPGWEFNPFGGGPRSCIGQQFALNEVSYVVVRLVQHYDDIQLMDRSGRMWYNTAIINKSANGVHIRLHRSQSC
ncbi:MAG: hypothetical protein Q9174_004739 [Haloplaca sp. 1 TL-2023]